MLSFAASDRSQPQNIPLSLSKYCFSVDFGREVSKKGYISLTTGSLIHEFVRGVVPIGPMICGKFHQNDVKIFVLTARYRNTHHIDRRTDVFKIDRYANTDNTSSLTPPDDCHVRILRCSLEKDNAFFASGNGVQKAYLVTKLRKEFCSLF